MTTSHDTSKTIEIPLTKGYVAIVDECDADLAQFNWYAHVGINSRIYARRSIYLKQDGKRKRFHEWMHKIILMRVEQLPIPPAIVDHVNGDSLDNKRGNLRLATHTQNLQNAQTQTRQKDKGILKGAKYHKRDKCWYSSIRVNGKDIHLGCFRSMESAHDAYVAAAIEHFGEFAKYE